MSFSFTKLSIPEVVLIEPKVFTDERGAFAEFFALQAFTQAGISRPLTQVNYSQSKQGVLRGLHYQLNPKAQAKLVSCVSGEIFDVAVDIRSNSPTYGQWVGQILSAANKHLLYVPAGFAHGFCVTSQTAEVIYFCDEQYSPEHEGGIIWNDPEITIAWPVAEPILAERDAAFPLLKDAKNNFTYV